MRYRIVANLVGGERMEVLTPDRGRANTWWEKISRLDLAGPQGASLTQESDDSKDVVLAITGAI